MILPTILSLQDRTCLLAPAPNGEWTLQTARNGAVLSSQQIYCRQLAAFDADFQNDAIFVAALTPENALLLLTIRNGRIRMEQLAVSRPPYRLQTPVFLPGSDDPALCYAASDGVRHRIVRYRRKNDQWRGEALLESRFPLSIKGIDKQARALLIQQQKPDIYTLLFLSASGVQSMAQNTFAFEFVQKKGETPVYRCGQTIFWGNKPLLRGAIPCFCENEILCLHETGVARVSPTRSPVSCFVREPWHFYALNTADFKGYLLSSPFPRLWLEDARNAAFSQIETLQALSSRQAKQIEALKQETETLRRQLTIVSGSGTASSLI